MNKLIIFDLDGVLIDSKNIHFTALNEAIKDISIEFVISKKDQLMFYEGLPTKEKLKLLTKKKGLDKKYYEIIWNKKQEQTKFLLNNIKQDDDLIKKIKSIKSSNIKVAVASNSIKNTILQCLELLGVSDLVDYVIGSDDVNFSKPHPEIYWKTISHFGFLLEDAVIFEDSLTGKIAANDSNIKMISVKNRDDLSDEKIEQALLYLKNKKNIWKDLNLNVIIPMAGAGNRFDAKGYLMPKPLIDVNGIAMIQAVVNNLNIDAKYTYIVQQEHYDKYNLKHLLNAITPNCNIVQVNGITDGAARTCLLANDYIDNKDPLLIVNSDQILEWNSRDFLYELYSKNVDGGIATFKSSDPKWSYAKTNEQGFVIEVAEKNPISDNATVGVYYWKHGSDFVKYANRMILNNIKTNGEFYVCPVFNEAINDNKKISIVPIEKMWGIGTPEDLKFYLKNGIKDA